MKKLNLKLAIYACAALIVVCISAFSYTDSKNAGVSNETLSSLGQATESVAACPWLKELIDGRDCWKDVVTYHYQGYCLVCSDFHVEDYYTTEYTHGFNTICKETDFSTYCTEAMESHFCD